MMTSLFFVCLQCFRYVLTPNVCVHVYSLIENHIILFFRFAFHDLYLPLLFFFMTFLRVLFVFMKRGSQGRLVQTNCVTL